MKPRPRHPRLAFTMIEVILVIGLLGVIMMAGGRLFVSAIQSAHSSAEAQNRVSAFDSAVSALGADTWCADRIDAASSRVTLTPGGGGPDVTWTCTSGVLTRHVDGAIDRTWPIGANVTFGMDDSALVLEIAPTAATAGERIRLNSVLRLLGRINP